MQPAKIIFICLFIASLFLFFFPVPKSAPQGNGLDKVVHIVMFACLVASGYAAFPRQRPLLFFLLLLYGPVIEVLQAIAFTYRSFDLKDIVADWLGILLRVWRYRFFKL